MNGQYTSIDDIKFANSYSNEDIAILFALFKDKIHDIIGYFQENAFARKMALIMVKKTTLPAMFIKFISNPSIDETKLAITRAERTSVFDIFKKSQHFSDKALCDLVLKKVHPKDYVALCKCVSFTDSQDLLYLLNNACEWDICQLFSMIPHGDKQVRQCALKLVPSNDLNSLTDCFQPTMF